MRRVGPSGPRGARILAVGEAPGAVEEARGEPFVGPAGDLFRKFLLQTGLVPEEMFLTNLSKYRPPENKLHHFFADGGIPNEIVRDGLAELIDEIRSVQPNVILALGNFPLWALTGKARWIDYYKDGKRIRGFTGIHDWRGSILQSTLVKGFKVIPTFHPSYIQQEGMSDHGSFLTDLERVKKESQWPEIRPLDKEIVLVEESPKVLGNYWDLIYNDAAPQWEPYEHDRFSIKEMLLEHQEVPTTLDIEFIPDTAKLLCCGVTKNSDQAFVLPTSSLSDLSYAGEIIRRTERFNAQNSMFDASILEWHYGLPIMDRVVFDTMVAAYCANVELPKGLDYLCSVYTDQPYYKGMVDWKLIKKGQQPLSIVYAYNGIDVWVQHQVMEEQKKLELCDPAVEESFRFLMKLLVPLWEMSKRGIRVDSELMRSVGEILEGEAAAKAFELMFLTGARELINVKSIVDVRKILYEDLGLPVIRSTTTGPATDDKTLAELYRRSDSEHARKIIDLIRGQRNARDLQSKFFDIEFDSDARLRGHYDPTKTVTGRLASRKFYPTNKGANQQNPPRDKRVRRAYLADRGKVFGYADLEKAESLVVAHLTQDPLMLFDHSPGQNAHKNLGERLFGKPKDDLDEFEYYMSKQTRHAGNYMEGPLVMMRNVNAVAHKTGFWVEFSDCKRFLDLYKQLHIGLPRWWRETEQLLWNGRTLENLIGFKRTFYGHIKSILPEGVAFVPQSTVGQVLNIGLLNVSGIASPYLLRLGLWQEYADIKAELDDCGFNLLQQIHDAVGFQCYSNRAERVAPLVRRALSIPLTSPKTREIFRIPVEVNLDIDPERIRLNKSNWGDCKKYEGDLVGAKT